MPETPPPDPRSGTPLENALRDALLEAPCAECGGSLFLLTPGATSSTHECPLCRRRTYLRRRGGRLDSVAETRVGEIVAHLRRRAWFCPDHDGVSARCVGLQTTPDDPLSATVTLLCSRRSGLFARRRHTVSMTVDLLASEAEMLGRR